MSTERRCYSPRAMETSLPAVLKELRLARGLTQREFADAVGLPSETIRSYEAGRRQPNLMPPYKFPND